MESKKLSPAAKSIEDKLQNNKALREIRREMGKFKVDCTKVTPSLRRGTLILIGKFLPLGGHEEIFQSERNTLLKAVQALPEVNKIIFQ
jgi:hypothetical protein